MKTTVELPESLVQQVRLRALKDRKRIKDTVAELLRKGLRSSTDSENSEPIIIRDKITNLPIIRGRKNFQAGENLTPERIDEILLEQEVEWHHGAR